MESEKLTIGKLIEKEVRKQQIPITEFARLICCQRNNVYDIFKFFKELADDLELINEEEMSGADVKKQKAVSQFFEVVPNILRELGKPSTIIFCKLDDSGYEDCATPDFGLPDYFITFTIGDTLQERIGNNLALPIGVVHDSTNNCEVEVCTNVVYGSVCVNVKLDYKTQDEWRKVLLLAFETYDRFGRR